MSEIQDMERLAKLLEESRMSASPSMDLGTVVDEPFVWTKNEFFISGQSCQRVVVQVTIETPDNPDGFQCKGSLMPAKSSPRPLPSSLALSPDFQISTKASVNQQLCFAQYLFKKQKRHMKLDVLIPSARSEEISQFVKCRPAVKALNFIHAPVDYQTWFVPIRKLENNILQCMVYFVEWDFFDRFCDQRYRHSLMNRKLNLVIHVEHFLADITFPPGVDIHRLKDKKKPFHVKLKVSRDQFLPLLEQFDITLVSCHSQTVINEVVRVLGLDRDHFLDEYHRRLFASIPKTTEGLYSFAQFYEFYHYRRRRNSVLGIGNPDIFTSSERDFIFRSETSDLLLKLGEVVSEFFQKVTKLDDAKAISLIDVLINLRQKWRSTP